MEGSVRSSRLPRRDSAPRLSIGFIPAHRFMLCAFGNFVDVLRLAADEGDRSRPILCEWTVPSDTMNPVVCRAAACRFSRPSGSAIRQNSITSWWSAN